MRRGDGGADLRPHFTPSSMRSRRKVGVGGRFAPFEADSCRVGIVDVISGHVWAHVMARGANEMGAVMRRREVASPSGVTVVGLMADPDAPTEIAQRIAQTLPTRLADRSDDGRRFEVEVVSEPFSSGSEDPPTLMHRIIDRASAANWDIVVGLTEIPLHSHGHKLVVDLSHEHGSALLSLPPLGGFRLQTRTRRAVEEVLLARQARRRRHQAPPRPFRHHVGGLGGAGHATPPEQPLEQTGRR
jgi:hypothetical protein